MDVFLYELLFVFINVWFEEVAGGVIETVLNYVKLAVEYIGEGVSGLSDLVGFGFFLELFYLINKIMLVVL